MIMIQLFMILLRKFCEVSVLLNTFHDGGRPPISQKRLVAACKVNRGQMTIRMHTRSLYGEDLTAGTSKFSPKHFAWNRIVEFRCGTFRAIRDFLTLEVADFSGKIDFVTPKCFTNHEQFGPARYLIFLFTKN